MSVNVFELLSSKRSITWKHKLVPLPIRRKNSDRLADLMVYINHYVLIKKLQVFLDKPDSKFICRQCLSSYSSQNVLIKHKQDVNNKKTAIRTNNEPHSYLKKHFDKNLLFFGLAQILRLIMKKIIIKQLKNS